MIESVSSKFLFVSPSGILKFEWVTETDCTNEGGLQDVGTVVFKGMFQYQIISKVLLGKENFKIDIQGYICYSKGIKSL